MNRTKESFTDRLASGETPGDWEAARHGVACPTRLLAVSGSRRSHVGRIILLLVTIAGHPLRSSYACPQAPPSQQSSAVESSAVESAPLVIPVQPQADSQDSGAAAVASQDASEPAVLSDGSELATAFGNLVSPDFASRQNAVRSLTQLSPDQIRPVMELALEARNLEVTQRILLLLEQFYHSPDPAVVMAASESLEAAATHPRWAVAESARDILDRNWMTRFQITQKELRDCGVFFNKFSLQSLLPGRFGRANVFLGGPVDSAMLQINVDQRWTGGERGLQLLSRLSDMAGPNGFIGTARMGVYLIDGHPLDETEVTRLKAAFGDSRVVSRGKVCLGITHDPTGSDSTGCRVAEVRPGTSAHQGGILSQDLIVAVGDTRIRDFDHLVDHLKNYEIGTVVPMEILRGGSPFQRFDAPRQPFDENADNPYQTRRLTLNVQLLGWDAQEESGPPDPAE